MIANVALPAFLPHSFATLLGLIVIAAIEGWFLMRVAGLSYIDSCKHSAGVNVKSTFVGIPFAWLLWVAGLIPIAIGVSILGLEPHPFVGATLVYTTVSGGVISNERTEAGSAAAWIVLLVPFWFGSVWIERRTICERLPDCDPAKISKAVITGNLASYSLFLIFGVVSLCNSISRHHSKPSAKITWVTPTGPGISQFSQVLPPSLDTLRASVYSQ